MKKYYYTIGEVCNLLDLKPHVLRYWEKEFSQLRPKKNQNRNRRYTPEDIEIVKKIRFMLYEQKFTIDGAKKRFKKTKKEVAAQLELGFVDEDIDKKQKIINDLKYIKEILNSALN
jgi:DNA-binding transcriptional MerR regulator